MATRRSADVDYARISDRGMQEVRRQEGEVRPRPADTPLPIPFTPDQGTRETEAPHPPGPGPRLPDTPPPAPLPARRGVQEARPQQPGAAPRLADQPAPLTATQKAEIVQNLSGAAFLFGATAKLYGPGIDVPTLKAYLDAFLKDA